VATRILLTTIPKCGKNVLVSFLTTLGLQRMPGGTSVADAAVYAQARWYVDTYYGGQVPHQLAGLLAGTSVAFDRILASLEQMPDGSYLQGHIAFNDELYRRARAAGVSIVFVYRDPRAALASLAHFLVERGEPASLAPRLPSRDLAAAQRLLLDGDEVAPSLDQAFAQFAGWRHAEGVHVLRFEDVIGARGHGSTARQLATFAALAEGIGWRGSPSQLLAAVASAFSPSAGTFRRGTIDGWRNDLRGLQGTEQWETLTALARSWGYQEESEGSPLGSSEAALGTLLDRFGAEWQQEREQRLSLDVDRPGLQRTIAQLQERIGELESGPASRIVGQVGRAAVRLAGTRSSRGKSRPRTDP
jgi:hypothetical protein